MDDLQTEVANIQKIWNYLNFLMSAKISNIGGIEKELIVQKVRRINREKIITDPRGLININHCQLLGIFDKIYLDNSKILSSIKTANSLGGKTSTKSSPSSQGYKSTRYQGGSKPVVVQATYVTEPGEKENCIICSKSGHSLPTCPEFSGGDPKVIRSLLLAASRCVGCSEPWSAGHKCDKEHCRPCRMGRMLCLCGRQKPGQTKDKRVTTGQAAGARPGNQSGASHQPGNNHNVISNLISMKPKGEILIKLGQAIIPREVVVIKNEAISCVYDSASSDCILDISLGHLCTNVHEKSVDLTTVNQTLSERKVQAGDLELKTHSGQIVKLEVIIMKLAELKYEIEAIPIPDDWVQTHSLPSPFNTGGSSTDIWHLLPLPDGPYQIIQLGGACSISVSINRGVYIEWVMQAIVQRKRDYL